MTDPARHSTVLAVILGDEVMAERGMKRHARLAFEALVLSAVALLITWPLRGAEGGAVAMFLTSAGLASRFDGLIIENRRLHAGGVRADAELANRLTARSVLALFLGIFTASVAAALVFGSERVERRYGFLLEITVPKEHSIFTQSFGPPLPLLGHNLLVLASAVVLGLVYRSFGLRIVLVWNAVSWGLVLPMLVVRALATGAHHPGALAAGTLVAVLPHLVLEALAYVTAGLAAVFASHLVTDDPASGGPSAGSCSRMFVVSLTLLVTAAALESYWAPLVLGAFRES
ncbi:MAG: hypothetical protein JWP97_6534 [Labilithrix sp.]|nr:hypothetical protein [Labilithrix sp.]